MQMSNGLRTAAAVSMVLACSASLAAPKAPKDSTIELNYLTSYKGSGAGNGLTGIEIPAYDPASRRAFAVNVGNNTVDVIDLSNPSNPTRVGVIDFSPYGGGVNSVAVRNGLVAVAAEANPKTDPGKVVFLNAATLSVVGQVSVGALPDMLVFTSGGDYLLVANEGEPNDTYTVDPEGTVSIVDLRNGVGAATVATAEFSAYNGKENDLRASGIRIYGKYTVDGQVVGSSAAQDFEPEYISVNGRYAYVTLQENNAIARIDFATATVLSVKALGFKDHSIAGNGLDPSDRDSTVDQANDNDMEVFGQSNVNGINIAPWPVRGMYQPDGVATLRTASGEVFLFTANEGDEREYSALNERTTVADVTLDEGVFPNRATLRLNQNRGRLRITNQLGRNPQTGFYEALYVPGARSFSVWTPDVEQVWDSGDDFESITAKALPNFFNSSHDENVKDGRSRSKGPEAEGITLGRIATRDYAFITFERIGGVAVYDVTNPRAPAFVTYANPRDFTKNPFSGTTDAGPEGVVFINAEDSPNGTPLLLVGNEVSQTLSVYEVRKLKK